MSVYYYELLQVTVLNTFIMFLGILCVVGYSGSNETFYTFSLTTPACVGNTADNIEELSVATALTENVGAVA